MSRIVESLYGIYGLKGTKSESLNEARNPENDEVNAILKNKIGKARLTKKEQEILDKYGITRDEDGDWIGPNGKRIWKVSGKSIYGPTAPGKYHKSRTWELGNQGGYPKNPQHKDSYDEVDFANYLTKEPTDFNYSQPYRGRAVNNEPYETPAMGKANRPYSDDYKTAKESRDYNQRRANDIDVMSDDEVEKEIDEYRKKLKQSQQSGQKVKDRIQGKADKNQKEIDNIIARAKAKHQKNESLEEEFTEDELESFENNDVNPNSPTPYKDYLLAVFHDIDVDQDAVLTELMKLVSEEEIKNICNKFTLFSDRFTNLD